PARHWPPTVAPWWDQLKSDYAKRDSGYDLFGAGLMLFRCPSCLSATELDEHADLTDARCTTCGYSFRVFVEETVAATHQERELIGRFELLRLLGAGTFGEVWLARDTQLDRQVAIKIPQTERLGQHARELFLREAQSAAKFNHPHVVGVHEVGC